jgi:hypothetical protein
MEKKLVLFLALILILPLFSAAPPVTTVQQFADGYIIEESQHGYLQLNKDYQYNFFVYNYSTGVEVDDTDMVCTLFLANSSGSILHSINATYDNYWYVNILGGNFSVAGDYPYGVNCQDDYGGALAGIFVVTESGVEMNEGRSVLTIGLLILLVFFLFISLYFSFSIENYIGKFTFYWVSHVLLILITFAGWQVGVEGLLDGVALTGIFRVLFWIFTLAVIPMVILSVSWIVYIHTFNEHFEKLIKKGEDPETAFKMADKKRKGWFNGKR